MNIRGLLNWFLSPSFDYYYMSQYDVSMVAQMICNEFSRYKSSASNNDYAQIYVPKIDLKLYESDFLKPVVEISNILHNWSSTYIKNVLVHGSLADLKYIKGWSDLDTLVVVGDEVLKDALALVGLRELFLELNKQLLKIDPIAHHGFIIVLESDLDNYNPFLLPPEVIRVSYSLYGQQKIKIRQSDCRVDWIKKFQDMKNTLVGFESSGIFKHHAYRGEYLTKDMISRRDGMYQFKYLIGSVMFIPSLYYTAIGAPVHKANSFDPFIKVFADSSSIIKCVSNIRADWERMEEHPYIPNRIPDWMIDRLPEDYISPIIKLLDDVINEINKE